MGPGNKIVNLKVFCGYKIDQARFLHRVDLNLQLMVGDLFNKNSDCETESSVAYCMSDSDFSMMSQPAEETWVI